MNYKKGFVLGILFTAFLLLTGCVEQGGDFYSCTQDSDCVSVKADCCGCNAGGAATAINRNLEEEWKNKLAGECGGMACPAVESDHLSCYQEPRCVGNRCFLQEPDKTVTVTTDRSVYFFGDTVELTVRNGLDKPIWYVKEACPPSCCVLHKWENDTWENLRNTLLCVQYTGPQTLKPDELKPGEEIKKQLDIQSYEDAFGIGEYKFSFYYGLSKDSFTEKIMYSNKFTIGERPFGILTPSYVIDNSRELINKKISVRGVAVAGFPQACTEMECSSYNPCCNSCSGRLLLEDVLVWGGTKRYIEIILSDGYCRGNGCVLNNCSPLDKGKTYIVNGLWGRDGLGISSFTEVNDGVNIITDKMGYGLGEAIQVTAYNGLDFSVYADFWKGGWRILEYQNGIWNEVFNGRMRELPACICGKYPEDKCPIWEAPSEKFNEIKSSETVVWRWDQKILKEADNGCSIWGDASPGKYKVEFRHLYTLDLIKGEWERAYSNEFTIGGG